MYFMRHCSDLYRIGNKLRSPHFILLQDLRLTHIMQFPRSTIGNMCDVQGITCDYHPGGGGV